MKHFLKEIVQTPVRAANGKLVVWEKLGQNYGVVALADDDPNVPFLTDLAQKHVGGVSVITAEQYEEVKKKLPYVPPKPKPQQEIRVMDTSLPPLKKSPAPQAQPDLTPPPDPLQERVRAATERAIAANAEAKKSATSAADAATSEPAEYFTPRVARPKLPKPEGE